MDEEPKQEAFFQIEGPDEDDCVWICSPKGRGVWCQNLGPTDKVTNAMVEWLGSIGRYPDTQFWAPLWNQNN